jgi:ankyrin repeat protein
MLDVAYREDWLRALLERGEDPEARVGELRESALHVAVRRRRLDAVKLLLAAGVDIGATTAAGMSAYRHARRRPFPEVARALAEAGADSRLTAGDEVAIALLADNLEGARVLLEAGSTSISEWTSEEQRLITDLASQGRLEGVRLLLDHGMPIDARGLDGGTALHTAAWFAQPVCLNFLVERGAPLDLRGDAHDAPPLGWVSHGSRYSGGAEDCQAVYADMAESLLAAGASLRFDEDPPELVRFLDATEAVRAILRRHGWKE